MSFDTLAPWYATLERLRFGHTLQKARCAYLSNWHHDPPENVLALGDGDGRFLQQALATWTHAQFVYVDASPGMLKLAKNRCGEERVHYVCQDIEAFLEGHQQTGFDLITTHFFLDCFSDNQLQRIIPQMAALLESNGNWIVTDFTSGQMWRHFHLAMMYCFFRLTTGIGAAQLPGIKEAIEDAGLVACDRIAFANGFVIAERFNRNAND